MGSESFQGPDGGRPRRKSPTRTCRLMSPRPGAGSRKELLLRLLSGVLVAAGVTLPWLSGCAAQQGCQVTVSYEVSLGQGTGALTGSTPYYYADVPIFFGQVGIYSNNVRALYSTQVQRQHFCLPGDRLQGQKPEKGHSEAWFMARFQVKNLSS